MPYKEIRELPSQVQEHLPEHAQEIYLAVFNNIWEEYKDPDRRYGNETRKEVSHKVVWAAVKTKYEKRCGEWVSRL